MTEGYLSGRKGRVLETEGQMAKVQTMVAGSKQGGSGGMPVPGVALILCHESNGDHQLSWLNPKSFVFLYFSSAFASANLKKPYLREEELELLELELEEDDGDLLLLCFLLLFFLTLINFTFDACRWRKN